MVGERPDDVDPVRRGRAVRLEVTELPGHELEGGHPDGSGQLVDGDTGRLPSSAALTGLREQASVRDECLGVAHARQRTRRR